MTHQKTFSDIGMAPKFVHVLDKEGYTHPTPIQEQSIPVALQGKDIFGCAQTGTGKTAAFSLPTLQRLDEKHEDSHGKKHHHIRSLIITPTRELAIQIGENMRKYAKKTNLRNTVIFGGVKQGNQVKAIKKGVEVLIATPGRLLDLINQKYIDLSHVEIFILDEADRMMDMGFINDIKKINQLIPAKRQTLFFSATTTPAVMKVAHKFLHKPVEITVTPASSTVDNIDQKLYTLPKKDKKRLLEHIIETTKIKSAVIFTRTKHGANKVAQDIEKLGKNVAALHGNKSQAARQKALIALKNNKIQFLVATDVAARGIDVDLLSHVIIYDVPLEPESYVHRIGRTGRAGEKGHAMMMCEPGEIKYLKQVTKLIGKDIPMAKDNPFHLDFSKLSHREISEATKASRPGGGKGRGGHGGRSGGSKNKSHNRSSDRGNSRSNDRSSSGGRNDRRTSHSTTRNTERKRKSDRRNDGR